VGKWVQAPADNCLLVVEGNSMNTGSCACYVFVEDTVGVLS